MTYAKLINGKLTLFHNPLQKDGMDIYNPPVEVLTGEGYKPYTEEDVDSSRLDFCDLSFEYQETDTEIRKVWVYTPNMEKAKKEKLQELKNSFQNTRKTAHCMCALDFEVDANEEANTNIVGLITVMKDGETTMFRAYDNSFHEVSREDLITMRDNIIKNSQFLYQMKWEMENRINNAVSEEELNSLVWNY